MSPPRLAALLVPMTLLAACQARPIHRQEVLELLDAQTRAWNRGDIPGFVSFYSRGLTFLGADGLVRGDQGLVERYQARYPDAEARGVLRLEIIEFRSLGPTLALCLGRYHLERSEPAEGYFTLVLERTRGGLEIVHDHTTAAGGNPGP